MNPSSIQGKVLIVRPSISMPGNTRTNEVLTNEVHNEHELRADAGRYVTQLYPKSALAPLSKIAGAARKRHKELTLQTGFGDLTPTALYGAWEKEMQHYIGQFDTAADSFANRYPSILAEARAMHKETFDPANYPPQHKIRGEFSFTQFSAPMPRAADVVVTHLTENQVSTIRQQLEQEAQRAIKESTQQMTQRILERVHNITQRLGDKDAVFRDSLIENLEGLIKIAPAMNIADDPQLAALISECKARLLVAPDLLRNDPGRRSTVFLHSKTIAGRFGLGGRKLDTNGTGTAGSNAEKKAA